MIIFVGRIDHWSIANCDAEVKVLGVYLLRGQVHWISVVSPSVKTEADLDVTELTEAKRQAQSSRN